MAGDVDLFGNEVAIPEPAGREKLPPLNDMRLVVAALRMATHTGLVLIGSRERVCRWISKTEVARVQSPFEQAVHQLIAGKWLTVGGTKRVEYGSQWSSARSVLVPKESRQASQRWLALHDPWKDTDERKGA